ncbi:endonuclease III domain-containing protein [Campylobacter sp. RM12642]|uniref:endonuclease III domain-containing protein n=1 Tax=Campylobacter sp. RM12642 TaxID=2735736 RepID=UPI0030147B8F|nr:endonuclease III domain-containing protein [Campylobacter sp. RM12642]
MINGASIFKALLKHNLQGSYEWQNYDDFSKFLALLIGQNTKWQNTQKALKNVEIPISNSINKLALIDVKELAELIKASGFYNTKAKKISDLAKAIVNDFSSFDDFINNASFDWIMDIKGIGFDTALMLSNFLLKKPIFVVNSNAKRFLELLGYEFNNYEEAIDIIASGLDNEYFYKALNTQDLSYIYMIFAASIDNLMQNHYKNKQFDEIGLKVLKELE